jgi:protein-L-isoaspartate(D-aspartate) O-methyltransferase
MLPGTGKPAFSHRKRLFHPQRRIGDILNSMPEGAQPDRFLFQREEMVRTQLLERAIRDERLLRAMSRVPRHEFIAPAHQEHAYADHPVPIGEGQTISQPYIVALTVQALQLTSSSKVLEIGTGSGYQTAILAELSSGVYSLERLPGLKASAENALQRLGYTNASLAVGDGSEGWPEYAPYHAIAVSAAAPEIPPPLIAQLADGGRMVIPVGPEDAQRLEIVFKQDGQVHIHYLEGCRFVPLIGAWAYPETGTGA